MFVFVPALWNWHSLNNVWLYVFDNRVCIWSNTFSFIPEGGFLPGLVIVQKLITLKLCVPEDISQRCLGANVVRKGLTCCFFWRWKVLLNLIVNAALVNLIIPIMKRNCWTKRSIRFKVYNHLQWWYLHSEFELGPLENGVYST